ncbi:tryptophan-rich sensory protein [Bartonella sp. HY329]|uniref:TspO/MBR family protein n=1 Tax=unclassified Bartonella TaxID=2645622 RepID=UPI0021C5F510|nr:MULTISPECIES: TspO/MBR family protein [unclassified Bartonella]UXM93924.1 tryptophan-rich sensory protein [Bartonella sp. HY329]UXN08245.1 tryptophan-rich sensory protein [Bartonella sp. HY328]
MKIMHKSLYAVLFIVAIFIIGGAIGYNFAPTSWYQELNKPFFTPPNWLFAPVWSILYIIIGFVGWRIFIDRPNDLLKTMWSAQLVINFAWTPLFFGLHQTVIALFACIIMLLLAIMIILKAWNSDKLVAILFIPYALWLALAAALNAGVVLLN